VVLTVNALQITVGKKNIANAPFSTDNGFFPLVATDSRHSSFGSASAKTSRLSAAVNVTFVRTDTAQRIGV
jgi:hypothetical protein